MSICPECKEVIDSLRTTQIVYHNGTLYKLKDNKVEEDYDDEDEGETTYNCPECSEELFDNYDDASDFLLKADDLADFVADTLNKEKK